MKTHIQIPQLTIGTMIVLDGQEVSYHPGILSPTKRYEVRVQFQHAERHSSTLHADKVVSVIDRFLRLGGIGYKSYLHVPVDRIEIVTNPKRNMKCIFGRID